MLECSFQGSILNVETVKTTCPWCQAAVQLTVRRRDVRRAGRARESRERDRLGSRPDTVSSRQSSVRGGGDTTRWPQWRMVSTVTRAAVFSRSWEKDGKTIQHHWTFIVHCCSRSVITVWHISDGSMKGVVTGEGCGQCCHITSQLWPAANYYGPVGCCCPPPQRGTPTAVIITTLLGIH